MIEQKLHRDFRNEVKPLTIQLFLKAVINGAVTRDAGNLLQYLQRTQKTHIFFEKVGLVLGVPSHPSSCGLSKK